MSDLKLRVTLERGGAERAGAEDPNFQTELNGVLRDLRGAGATVSPVVFTMDSVDGGSGALVGQYLVAVGPYLASVSAVLVAWLTARSGRRVTLSVGNTSVSANSVEELERLLAIAAKFDKNSTSDNPFKK